MSLFDLGQPGQRAFSSAARFAFRMLFRAACRIRVEHLDPIPRKGPLILAANHISHFDPPLVGSLFPRAVDWMAMDELFQNDLFARGLDLAGAFRVQRDGSDRTALRTAARRLQAGRVVGIFPEGGIRAGESSILEGAPMRPGVGALALLGRAPILPCVVIGTDRLYKETNWLRRPPVWVLTGRIIDPFQVGSELTRPAIHRQLAAAFRLLRTEAILRFGLTADDLPSTPQARKGQDPFAPL
ncbi:MAG TPA: lysophospholipid acyltransferase family protein [Chthoniobacterales bacterium]